MDALVQLKDHWNENWLDELAEETVRQGQQEFANWPSGLPEAVRFHIRMRSGKEISVDAQRGGRGWGFRGTGGYVPPYGESPPNLPGMFEAPVRIEEFSTVSEIQRLWDSLEKAPQINFFSLPPELLATLQSGSGQTTHTEIVQIETTQVESDHHLSPAMYVSEPTPASLRMLGDRFTGPLLSRGRIHTVLTTGSNEITHVWSVGITSQGDYANLPVPPSARKDALLLQIPLHVFYVPVRAQERLRDLVGLPLALGQFAFSFAELDQHSKGLEDLPIKKLRDYLASQGDSVKDDIEVFGLKFQGSALGSWGLLVLSLIQLYFAVTFRNFVELRVKYRWSYPWLALYPDILSRFLFVASGLIFPMAIVMMLAYRHFADTQQWLLTCVVSIGIGISVGASAWTAKLYRRLLCAVEIS